MRVNKAVSYSLHPETSTAVHHLEEVLVLLTPEPVKSGNLKVTPEMAHVVCFALHGLGIYIWDGARAGLCTKNVFRERLLVLWVVLGQFVRWLLRLGLEEHVPEASIGNVVDAFVGRGVSEDIRYCLFEFLDCNGKAIGLVVFLHVDERIAETYQ
jgi:hypothetical protein